MPSILPSPKSVSKESKLERKALVAGIMAQIAKVLAHPPALNNKGRYLVSFYGEQTATEAVRRSVEALTEADGWTATWVHKLDRQIRGKYNGWDLFVRPADDDDDPDYDE